jgi:hypothetical protein
VPSTPTAVSVIVGSGSITVSFSAPASDGGTPITGYTATCVSSNGGVAVSNTGSANSTSIQVRGITEGKRYSCAVRASNAVGAGAPGAPRNVALTPSELLPILNLLLHMD